jgi:hypothetical protein
MKINQIQTNSAANEDNGNNGLPDIKAIESLSIKEMRTAQGGRKNHAPKSWPFGCTGFCSGFCQSGGDKAKR